jgi:tRNA 2-selenouridine synthase
LNINFEARLDNIVKDYGRGDLEKLVNAIIRIQKRLGGLEAKNAIQFLMDADIRSAFSILLRYYDNWYTKGLGQHRPNLDNLVVEVALPGADAGANANTLLGIFRRQKAENPA